jgi:hypothetical protein
MGSVSIPGKLVDRECRRFFVEAGGSALEIHRYGGWRWHHRELSGAPLRQRRDFWCGGTAGAPTHHGIEHADSMDATVFPCQSTPPARLIPLGPPNQPEAFAMPSELIRARRQLRA